MLQNFRRITGTSVVAALLTALLFLTQSNAQTQDKSSQPNVNPTNSSVTAVLPASVLEKVNPIATATKTTAPVFTNYKGVKLGMNVDEVRRLLGKPKEKSNGQDFFAFSERETAQIFYEGDGKVFAVAVTYYGSTSGPPTPSAVFGKAVTTKDDGSIYHVERYSEAGYWVSFNRTAGGEPLYTVTMQKLL